MDFAAKPKPTKNQRKEQRWNRVHQTLQKRLRQSEFDGHRDSDHNNDDASFQESETKLQIKKSRDIVDDASQQMNDNVHDIKLTADIKATQRRAQCEEEHESRMLRLEQCLEHGREINVIIDNQWNRLHSLRNPQTLFSSIKDTKEQCKQLVTSYESVRKEFLSEFKKKSEQYVALLKSEENDVSETIWRMHDSVKRMKDEYESQLIEIEKAFMTERREIIEQHQKQLDDLYGQRSKQEFLILEQQIASNDKYHDDLERVRREDQESYNKLKINLENHIQLLEQQLEEMRAMYQLNTEKLNYNFQVLKEREKENITTVDQLKRREKKLKESVTNIKEKYVKLDKKFKEDYKVLNDDYTRTSKQYKELQRKFKHFQQTDTQKYEEICQMNRDEAVHVLQQIMKCDQIICTQLLGMEWNANQWQIPPRLSEDLQATMNNQFHTKGEADYHLIATTFHATSAPMSPQNVVAQHGDKDHHNNHRKHDEKEKESKNDDEADAESSVRDDEEEEEESHNITKLASSRYSTEQIMNVMKLLIAEAPFLISGAVKDAVFQLSVDQQLLVQCDSILSSLGIEDIEDLEELMSLFVGSDNKLCVEPYETVQTVKQYVSDRDHTKTADLHATNFGVKHALTSVSREKQERRKRKDQEYWTNLQHVFPSSNAKLWSALETYMIKYTDLLETRKREALKIVNLQQENEQLRQLLQQYLSSDANKQLIIPPSLVMDAQTTQQM